MADEAAVEGLFFSSFIPFFIMYLSGIGALLLATGTFVSAATTTSSGVLAVASPTWLPSFSKPSGVNSGYPTGPLNLTDSLPHTSLNLKSYPDPWAEPTTDHPEIKAVMDAIDWTKVPKAPIRKAKSNGDLNMEGYNENNDPYCWWSDTNCVKPKASYLPRDISICPNAGDWGLNYDDGPFNPQGDKELDKWAEPELYNFLAKTNNQKATLFVSTSYHHCTHKACITDLFYSILVLTLLLSLKLPNVPSMMVMFFVSTLGPIPK